MHTWLLIGLHAQGLTWEAAYNGLWVGGAVAALLALTWWLVRLVGGSGAACALVLLAIGHFQEQGLHAIVPSTMSVILAMVGWAIVMARQPRWDQFLPIVVFAIGMMHSAGSLWSAGCVAGFWWLRDVKDRRFAWVLAVTLLAWMGPALVNATRAAGIQQVGRFVNPLASGDGRAVWDNLATAFRISGAWVLSFAGGASTWREVVPGPVLALWSLLTFGAMAVVGRVGWRAIRPESRRDVGRVLAILAVTNLITIAYVAPGYPAPLFVRSWVLVAVGLTALIGAGMSQIVFRGGDWTPGRLWGVTLVLCLVSGRVAWAVPALRTLHDSVADRGNWRPSPSLLTEIDRDPRAAVAYSAEAPMYYVLTHGGLKHGAVFVPTMSHGASELLRPDLRYVVGMSPGAALTLGPDERLSLIPDEAQPCEALTELPAAAVVVAVDGGQRDGRAPTVSSDGWINIASCDRVSIRARSGTQTGVRILGMRRAGQRPRVWPWGASLRVTHANGDAGRVITFDADQTFGRLGRPVDLLDDRGDFILGKLGPVLQPAVR